MSTPRMISVFREELLKLDESVPSAIVKSPPMDDISSHVRMETRLSLDEILKEGKPETLRRYSKVQIVPVEEVSVHVQPKLESLDNLRAASEASARVQPKQGSLDNLRAASTEKPCYKQCRIL